LSTSSCKCEIEWKQRQSNRI